MLPFLSEAPNRLSSGTPVHVGWGHGLGTMAILIAGGALGERQRRKDIVAALAGCWGIMTALIVAGETAGTLAAHAVPATRIMLGPGFWLIMFAFVLAVVDALQTLRARPGVCLAVAALAPLCVACLAWAGGFQALSLAREAATHRTEFAAALVRHLVLVGATLGLALGIGAPLGVAVQRRPAWQGTVFAVLNIVQTIPSVALFGLLIAPLSAAGLSGIGVAPALIALVLYALLPIVRAVVSGLDGVEPAARDAAAGLGFTRRNALWAVELPLAAPALIAGLRIVTVQTIGLAVVAALIGAGGLGDFVFQGLGQYAVDLVLLGALPAIALALAADLLLRLTTAPLQARLR